MKILHLGPIIFHSDDNSPSKKSVSKIGGLSNSIIKLALGQSENNNKVAVLTTRETDEPKHIGIDFLSIGKLIAELKIPTLFVMEGGYNINELGVNVVNVLQGFEG